MKNRFEVKVTDEWVDDFARRNEISPMKAKFLLSLVVGFDNITYAFSRLFKKKKKD